MAINEAKLKLEHELFCQRYILDFNGTQAYKHVYPNSSDDAARSSAPELLAKPSVARRIAELLETRISALEVTGDLVIDELKKLAKVDPKEAYNEDGTLKRLHDMPEHVRKAISSISYDSRGNPQIKFWPKEKALETLGRYMKLFNERIDVNHSGKVSLEDLVSKSFDPKDGDS